MKSLLCYTTEQWCYCSCDSVKIHGSACGERCYLLLHQRTECEKKDKLLSEKMFFSDDLL